MLRVSKPDYDEGPRAGVLRLVSNS